MGGAPTIAAISTPLGTGGIGIIRISGPDALTVAGRIFIANSSKSISEMLGYTSVLGKIYENGSALDDAICQIFRAPKSYTGEDVAELSCHGGLWLLKTILRLCFENGAQPASPGEFTKRAFLNGKLDLTQAEAVMDLISAKGQSAAKAAFSARKGKLSTDINEIVEELTAQSAHLAAWADFPEEDLEELDIPKLAAVIDGCIQKIDALLKTYDSGRISREGVSTAIIGKPNVGKSTLMNLLAGEERSIVTDIPGTTRDVVEDNVRLGNFVLRLADTAGIRETLDPVELEGVARSRSQMLVAELVLAVFDSADSLSGEDIALLEQLEGKPCIAVINKIDLPGKLDAALIKSKLRHVVAISAKTGEGRRKLEKAVTDILGFSKLDASAGIVANERQRLCLQNANDSLNQAMTALTRGNMLDAVNVCIDFALDELLSLTGKRVSDHVINEVFSKFCVGK